ncbi:MAG: efflux transporter outer membrane subunit [Stenotrophobium sp.]
MKPRIPGFTDSLFTSCLVPLTAVVLLAACSVGPQYVRPAGPDVQAYTREPLNHLGGDNGQRLATGSGPAQDWWTLFQSPALNNTMQQALTGNHTLAAAEATLAQAREVVTASSGARYPQVSLDGGAGRQKYGAEFGGPAVPPPFTYFAIGPSVSYLLDYTGGTARAIEQQQAQADTAAFQLQAAYLSLTSNVAQQSLASAAARAQIAAVQALLAEDEKNVSLVQSAFAAGAVTRVDVLSAQSQFASDQTLLPPLHQQLSVAQHALSVLVGQAPANWTPPEFALSDFHLPQSLPLSLPSELAHQRPDILAAEAQLHAATAAVGVATSNLYPQIRLTTNASQQSTTLVHLFDASSTAWGLVAGLTAPVFDGGTLRAQRRGAEDAMHAAAARYQQVILQAFGQVADALTALDQDSAQLAAQQNARDTAKENLALARESYHYGNSSVLTVLDAERLFQKSELGYVRAQAQRYQDTAQLLLALGGGTTLAPDAKTQTVK